MAKKKTVRATPKTARATPKVSPLRGSALDDYLAQKVSGWQAEVVRHIAALVAEVVPEAALVIKWAQPVFELGGPFAYVRASKAHVTFGFWRGAELADPDGVLEGDGDRMKHLKIASLEAFDRKRCAAFVRAAAALNRDKGDPTRRSA